MTNIIVTSVGEHADPTSAKMATGLRAVFERRGHEYTKDPEAEDLRIVLNFIDIKNPRPYRRRAKAIFVVALAVTTERPDNVLRQGYPLLVRSLANLCVYLVRADDAVHTYFVTLEQGYYPAPDLAGEDYFDYVYDRLHPLASSQLVIDNEFVPDLEKELWDGDALTKQLGAAGRRLDALALLPAPFPIHELLDERDLRPIERVYWICGGSSWHLWRRTTAWRVFVRAGGGGECGTNSGARAQLAGR